MPAPGFGSKDKSKSGSAPHLVSVVERSGVLHYKCDDKCLHFKSINICSHCVAAAEVNGDLIKFLHCFNRTRGKQSPNLSSLSTHGMPAGAGRKGGKAAKKKVPPKHIVDEENRVPLNVTPQSSSQHISSALSPIEDNFQVRSSGMSSVTINNNSRCLPAPPYSGWSDYSSPSSPPYYQNPSWQWSPSPWNWQGMAPTLPIPHTPPHIHSTEYPPYFASPSVTPQMPSQSSASSQDTFKVCFKVGNISVCSGCRNNFSVADQIVLQHPEFRNFNSPRTGLPTSKYGNAYYHVQRRCIEWKWGVNFEVIIADSVKTKLTPSQKDILVKEFNVTF